MLEIGCGTGVSLAAIDRQVGASGRAVGLDLSMPMCRRAMLRGERESGVGATAVVRADAVALPFPSGRFDAVFLSFTLELFADMSPVLAEIRRVVGPGGRVSVVAVSSARPNNVMSRAYQWGHRRFPRVLDCRPIPLLATLDAAGMAVYRSESLSLWGLPVAVVAARTPVEAPTSSGS